MKVQTILTHALSLACLSSAYAQTAQIKATIIKRSDGKNLTRKPLFIDRVHRGKIFYRLRSDSQKQATINLSGAASIFQVRPKEFVEAVELFENREYAEALKKFIAVKQKYAKIADMPNSIPALAGLYELDCYRKLKQFDKLAKAEKVFSKGVHLTRQSHKDQLKIYKLWGNLEDGELGVIAREYEQNWKTKKLPNYLRAQVEFLYGKSLEKNNQKGKSLIAYAKAMTADFAASEAITAAALKASFDLVENDKEAQEIRKLWDARDRDNLKPKLFTMPFYRLLEAGGLVKVHNKLGLSGYNTDGSIVELDKRYAKYAKYTMEAAKEMAK